jgi:hypothetical protein
MNKETQKKLEDNPLTHVIGIFRGHTDLEISEWIDREGRVDLDRLTTDDIELAERFIAIARCVDPL